MSWLPTANSYTSVLNPDYDRQNAATSLYSHYNYVPNRGFNIFAAIVWALVFLAHLYWLIARQRRVAETGFVAKGRTRSIQSLFLLGSALEFVVYVLRSISHSRPFHARLFQAQYVINLFTPLLFVMAMQLGLLKALAQPREHHLLAFNKPKPIIQTLLALSAIALVLNLVGSAIWSVAVHTLLRAFPTSLSARAGREVLTAGQAIEITSLFLTLALLTWVLIKFFQSKNHTVYYINKLFLLVLFLTLGMLFTRAIYRLVETRQGWWGRAWSSEALFGVFEFATVWTAVATWAAWPMRNTLDSVRDDHSIPITNKRVSNDTVLTHNTAVNGPGIANNGYNGTHGHGNGALDHNTVGHQGPTTVTVGQTHVV